MSTVLRGGTSIPKACVILPDIVKAQVFPTVRARPGGRQAKGSKPGRPSTKVRQVERRKSPAGAKHGVEDSGGGRTLGVYLPGFALPLGEAYDMT